MNHLLSKNLGLFIWHFLKPHKFAMATFILIAAFAGLWAPFNSMLIKYMINHLTAPLDISLLMGCAVLLALNFIVFGNITWRLIGCLNYKFQPIIKNQIINQTFRYVLDAHVQFFHDNLSGRISNQITSLADNIERIIHDISPDLIRGIALLIVVLISMYFVDARFFYTLVIWFLAFSFLSIVLSKRLVHLSDLHAESESMISGQLVDSITNIGNVRAFARQDYEALRLENPLNMAKGKFRTRQKFILILNFFQGLLIALMLGFMAYFLVLYP